MGEGLKALVIPHKAPILTHLYHMSDAVIFPHKAAARFESRAHHIAPGGFLQATIQALGISANRIQLISVAKIRTIRGLLECLGAGDPPPRATLPSAPHARPRLIHPNLISYSTPYQSLVLSRARRYSGTPTHRLAEERKSSGKNRGLKILVSVVRFRPRAPLSNTISMT